MQKTILTPDILVCHLRPQLCWKDLRSLSSTSLSHRSLLFGLAFCTYNIYVRTPISGFILDILSPLALSALTGLVLNGTPEDHMRIFACKDFISCVSIGIIAPLLDNQIMPFTTFSRQLCDLTDYGTVSVYEFESYVGTRMQETVYLRASSLDTSTPRTFGNFKRLCLRGVLPPELSPSMFGNGTTLTTLDFLPDYSTWYSGFKTTVDPISEYGQNCHTLLSRLTDGQTLPVLRLVRLSLPIASRQNCNTRMRLLTAAWKASRSHRESGGTGWRLQNHKPDTPVETHYFGSAMRGSWGESKDHFLITVSELASFQHWAGCEDISEYIFKPLHILDIGLDGNIDLSEIPAQVITMVGDQTGWATPSRVWRNAQCLNISFNASSRCHIGAVPDLVGLYPYVKKFRFCLRKCVAVPLTKMRLDPGYTNLKLQIPRWRDLCDLSLPARAFQTDSRNGPCNLHSSGYYFPFISTCLSLRRLEIIEWLACHRCHNRESKMMLHTALEKWLPNGIEHCFISGKFSTGSGKGEKIRWKKIISGQLESAIWEATKAGGHADTSFCIRFSDWSDNLWW